MDRFHEIEELFQSVVDLAPRERHAILAAKEPTEPEIVAEVRKLLTDYDEAGDFIESPVWTDSIMLGATARDRIGESLGDEAKREEDAMIGRRLGVYQLTKELGRGGMGAVYLAERVDGEFRQRVALKVIKRGMDTDFIVRRFRNERQILASLDHPNIARLLDGGTTDDGLPYFVMEFIEGSPVYGFSDARRLSISERLRLFVKICEAVDYAHENLIIHRDIKPTNILVTGDGTPKLLDFGIAKILDPELAADSVDPTATAMRMMTPEYASPEQVRGEAVTRASDIYSLGVLLYELLTGHRPYKLKNRGIHEIARVICEEEPETLGSSLTRDENFVSTRDGDEKTTLEWIFESRRGDRESLRRELSGDLERVVFKALRKSADERYATAVEFAADIKRYLGGETVEAPEVSGFRTASGMFPKPAPDEISVAVLPMKIFDAESSDDTGDEYLRIGLADALITRLSNVSRFVVRPTSSVLRYGGDYDPIAAGEELGVAFVVDGHIRRVGSHLRVSVQLLNIREGAARWAEKFDEEFTDVLSLEDSISEKIAEALLPQLTGDERDRLRKRGTNNAAAMEHYLHGRHYWNSFTEDGFAKAIVAYYQAIAFDPNYALAYAGIADYHNWLGIYGVLPARECFQSAIENARTAIDLDPQLGEAYAALAFAQHGGSFLWQESEDNFQTALDLGRNVGETHVWYSIKRTTEGRFVEGITHAARGIELDPQTPFNYHNLGWVLYYARQYDEAVRQYQKTARLFPDYPLAHYGLAWVLRRLGRFDEALVHAERVIELLQDSVFALHVKGQTLAAAGRRDEAREVLRRLEQLEVRQFMAPYHTALIYAFLGETDKALENLEKSAEIGDAWLVWLCVEPAFDKLRAEPRFRAVAEHTKNPMLRRGDAIATGGDIHESHIATRIMPVMTTAETAEAAPPATPKPRLFLRYALVAAGVFLLLIVLPLALTFREIRWTENGDFDIQFGNPTPNRSLATAPQQKSIGMLPFETDQSNENEESFAVGLTESVAQKLRQVKEISLKFALAKTDRTPDLASLRRDFSVDFVLRGKLHIVGDRVIVDAELVSTADNKTVWTEKFEENLADLQSLLTKISERVLKAMTVEVSSSEKQQISKNFTTNSEAYQLYLVGRFQLSNRSAANLQKAIKTFEKARTLDPKFALAYAGLADAYALQNLYQIPPPADAYDKAKQNAIKSIELDPNLAEAHASLGYVLFYHDHETERAIAELGRAIELNPGYSSAHHWLALMLSSVGRHDDAARTIRQAAELEPRSAIIQVASGMVNFYARNFDEAVAIADRVIATNEGFIPAYKLKRMAFSATGNYSAALTAYQNERIYSENTDEGDAGWLMIAAQVQAAGGLRDEALANLRKSSDSDFVRQNPSGFAYEIATGYALLGDADNAVDWLAKAKAANAYGMNFVNIDPRFDNVRNSEKFKSLVGGR